MPSTHLNDRWQVKKVDTVLPEVKGEDNLIRVQGALEKNSKNIIEWCSNGDRPHHTYYTGQHTTIYRKLVYQNTIPYHTDHTIHTHDNIPQYCTVIGKPTSSQLAACSTAASIRRITMPQQSTPSYTSFLIILSFSLIWDTISPKINLEYYWEVIVACTCTHIQLAFSLQFVAQLAVFDR